MQSVPVHFPPISVVLLICSFSGESGFGGFAILFFQSITRLGKCKINKWRLYGELIDRPKVVNFKIVESGQVAYCVTIQIVL